MVSATRVCPTGDLCLQVNNNGVVSFGTRVPEFTPQPFPLPGHRPFVAPYWADVDTRLGGDVFYRQSRDPQLLARLAQDLVPAVPPGDSPPRPTWAFVATWDRVAYFGAASNKVGHGTRWGGSNISTCNCDVPNHGGTKGLGMQE